MTIPAINCADLANEVRFNLKKRLPDYAPLFRRYNFFDLFPLDGGGYFVFMDCLGTLDDLDVADHIVKNNALKKWGTFGDLNFAAAVSWEQVEWAMWIQRLYVLPSLARAYWLSGNSSYKSAAIAHLKDWSAKNPCPENPGQYLLHERQKFESQGRIGDDFRRSWFDFQPAARVIYLSWSLYFLLDVLDDEEILFFVKLLRKHAEILLKHLEIWPEFVGNHASYWALALGYFGFLFPNDELAPSCIDYFNRLIKDHFDSQIGSDGLSREGSPSYMYFSAMQYREACMLPTVNNAHAVIQREDLKRIHQSLSYLMLPDGNCANVNDGYSSQGTGLLESLETIIGRDKNAAADKPFDVGCFADSGYVVARTNRGPDSSYVLLDTTRPLTCGKASHAHGGKLGIIYYAKGRLLIGDSGTGPYNQDLFGSWFRRAKAHSTIMIDQKDDAEFLSEWEWDRLPDFQRTSPQMKDDGVRISAVSDGYLRLEDPVSVTREVVLKTDGAIQVNDRLLAQKSHTAQWIFRIPFQSTVENHDGGIKICDIGLENEALWIVPVDRDGLKWSVRQEPYYADHAITETPSIVFEKAFTGNLRMQFAIGVASGE